MGVDVFFIVSGYVMFLSASRVQVGHQGAIEFLLKRILRVFPLYLVVTVAWFSLRSISGAQYDWRYVVDSLLLLPTKYGQEFSDPVLHLGWTLRFELYFYLLVGVGIAVGSRLFFPIAGIIVSFLIWVYNGYYYGAPIVLEFIGGFLLAFFMLRRLTSGDSRLGDVVGFVFSIILLLLASIGKDTGYVSGDSYTVVPRMWIVYGDKFALLRPLAWGVPSLFLVYYAVKLEGRWTWSFARFGKYTFSLYLLQVFSNSLAAKLKLFMPDIFAFACGMLVLSGLTYISFRYFETPILNLMKKARDPRQSSTGSVVGGDVRGDKVLKV
ncbi:acyltransferase [Bdellovibrio sp. SKB1291214]|nr:acyltransferase [Bdellovibrio sp. SKB1291214]